MKASLFVVYCTLHDELRVDFADFEILAFVFCSEFSSYVKVILNAVANGDKEAQLDCFGLGIEQIWISPELHLLFFAKTLSGLIDPNKSHEGEEKISRN